MNCLNPGEKDPSLLGNGHGLRPTDGTSYDSGVYSGSDNQIRSLKKQVRLALLCVLGLLAFCLVLLGLVIWLAVEMHDNRNAINNLTSSASISTLPTTGSADADLLSAAYPAAYLSLSPNTSSGYSYSGSLFRGSGYWAQQSALSQYRAGFDAVAIDYKMYAMGGHDGNGTYLTSIFEYDSILDVDQELAVMPEPRTQFAAGVLDNATIVLVGGYASAAADNSSTPESCTLLYDVGADSWSQGPCLVEPRASACGAVVDGRLFVAGGTGSGGTPLASIEVFDPSSNAWSTFAQLPYNRTEAACATLGNSLVVAGGLNASNMEVTDVIAVDMNAGNMTALGSLLYPRFGLRLAELPTGDRLVAIGGGQLQNGTQVGLHYVEEYAAGTNVWTEKALMDTQRFGFGAAYLNEGVYVMGGLMACPSVDCNDSVTDSVEVFFDASQPDVYVHIQQPGVSGTSAPNASQVLLLASDEGVSGYTMASSLYEGSGYWSPAQPLPNAISDLNVVNYGTLAYVVGGLDLASLVAVDTLYMYDPLLDTYTNMSAMPEPRARGGAAVVGDKIVYAGGFSAYDLGNGLPVDTTLLYDIPSDTWSASNATLSFPRSDLCMAAVGGNIYASGGYSSAFNETLGNAEVYDPDSDTWTVITDMPTPRGDLMCGALNGQFVAVGGYWDPTNMFSIDAFRTEVQAYDPGTGQWTSLAPLPVARGDSALAVIPSAYGDRMLVMGGETHAFGDRTQVATHQVQEYSSSLDTWYVKAPMSVPRFRFGAAWVNGEVLVFGGATTSLCNADASECTDRPVSAAEGFFDSDNPDLFIYTQAS